ncbi:hypothetical protein HNQ36_003522 [Afipia massiliensis]|uniref:Uncharacterized protein n=1 Tax=Afipia massiliensis TaxID=211460 RepID=A0A840N3N7_9BRAD|nr:hypothetical protein [Afipia massiliensis]
MRPSKIRSFTAEINVRFDALIAKPLDEGGTAWTLVSVHIAASGQS